MNISSSKKQILTVIAVMLMFIISACSGGDSPGDNTLNCGDHGKLVGDTCVCDPGYTFDGKTCISAGNTDGDDEESDIAKDGDPEKTTPIDGDEKETTPVEDGDEKETTPVEDGDETEKEETDTDKDVVDLDKEKPCKCSGTFGVFCTNPAYPNPADYQQLEVLPALNKSCDSMVVSIRKSNSAALTETQVFCNDEGKAQISDLGCELSYRGTNSTYILACGSKRIQDIYYFSADNCKFADGDDVEIEIEEEDILEIEEDDLDEEDIDPEETGGEGVDEEDIDPVETGDDGPDEEEIDDTPEIDEEATSTCVEDKECPTYHYCNYDVSPRVCTLGCHPGNNYCIPGVAQCNDHGLCIPIIFEDGDKEEEPDIPCTKENEATLCGDGHFCLVSQGLCTKECSISIKCETGEHCDLDRGKCVSDTDPCKTDSDCSANPCNICELGSCVKGECCPGDSVGYCSICVQGKIVDDPACQEGDGDEEEVQTACTDQNWETVCPSAHFCLDGFCYQECTEASYCIAKYNNQTYYCTTFGQCMEDTKECDTHQDCITKNGPRHYCSGDYCYQDCADNSGCSVPPVTECNEFGQCIEPVLDGDVDEINCNIYTGDIVCDEGDYCKIETGQTEGTCTHDCTQDTVVEDCGANKVCSYRGRCQDPEIEEDEDLAEIVEVIMCATDGTCPPGYVCQPSLNTCDYICKPGEHGKCHVGYKCDANYECTIPCDANEDCGQLESDDMEFEYDMNKPCTKDIDCPDPAYEYCDTNVGFCRSECFPCPDGYICDRGKCILTGGEVEEVDCENDQEGCCLNNEDCPDDQYCGLDFTCKSDCTTDWDCNPGWVCGDRGICRLDFPECQSHVDCPVGMFCDSTIYPRHRCDAECLTDDDCLNQGGHCNNLGKCAADESVAREKCTQDIDCPVASYCKGEYCGFDCLPPNKGCTGEDVCLSTGKCGPRPDPPSEEDGDEMEDDEDENYESDLDSEEGDGTIPQCSTNADCPYNSHCADDGSGTKRCTSNCMNDSNCSSGKVCDCKGFCVDSASEDTTPAYCASMTCSAGCLDVSYCWQDVCRMDCVTSVFITLPCPSGFDCTPDGQCVPVDGDIDEIEVEEEQSTPEIICKNDSCICPYHTVCNGVTERCEPAGEPPCISDHHCGDSTKGCNYRGECVTKPVPDQYAACYHDKNGNDGCLNDESCPDYSYCWDTQSSTGKICRTDCVNGIPGMECESGTCTDRGKCQ